MCDSVGCGNEPLVELARLTTRGEAGVGSDDELFARVLAFERLRTVIDAGEATVLAELDARGACDAEFGLRTGSWLAHNAGLPAAVAKARLAVAVKLRRVLPLVAGALAAGTISWDHARVVAELANPRIEARVADEQAMLVQLAVGMRFELWRHTVRALGQLWDEDGGYDPREDDATNTLSYTESFDGLLQVVATFTGERAETIKQGIEAKTDELFRRAVADHQTTPELAVPSRATLRAFAMEELFRQALGIDVATTKAPRTAVSLVIKADNSTVAFDPDGVRLADGTTRVLLCDPEIHAIVVDSLGIPLDLGRHVRWASDNQRRAANVRDGGCVFPGCDAPARWCDLHHCDHWEHGGPTDLANLASLCRHHHRVIHRAGWHLHTSDDGWHWFTTPNGHTLWAQRHNRQRPEPPPPPATPTAEHRPNDKADTTPNRHGHGTGRDPHHGPDRHRRDRQPGDRQPGDQHRDVDRQPVTTS